MQTATRAMNMDFTQPEARQSFQRLAETVEQQTQSSNELRENKLNHTKAMASLWKRLGEVLGASFLNQFGAAEEDAYHTWSAGLADLSPEQIKSGFANYMRSDDRFLDLKRFRSMCLNLKAYGLPEAEAAYREAAGHCHEWKTWSFSHVAVSKALVETGIAVMRQCTESQSKPVFLRNYQIVCRRVMAGETIESPIPKAIPDHIPKLCTREQNIDHLAALRAATGL